MFEIEMEKLNSIRERWIGNQDEISRSEVQTRISLIDPILELCGWEVGNPKVVRVEYSEETVGRTPDYVLLDDKKVPIAAVEAKRVKSSFPTQKHVDQAQSNSTEVKAAISIFTNGVRWIGWNSISLPKLSPRDYSREFLEGEYILFNFNIEDTKNGGIYLEMEQILELWRPRLIRKAGEIRGEKTLGKSRRRSGMPSSR